MATLKARKARIVIPRWRIIVARILMEPVGAAYSLGFIGEAVVDGAAETLARWAVAPAKIVEG